MDSLAALPGGGHRGRAWARFADTAPGAAEFITAPQGSHLTESRAWCHLQTSRRLSFSTREAGTTTPARIHRGPCRPGAEVIDSLFASRGGTHPGGFPTHEHTH